MALVGAVGAAGPLAVDPFAGLSLTGHSVSPARGCQQVAREEKTIFEAKRPRRGRKRGIHRTSLMRPADEHGLETDETTNSPSVGSKRRAPNHGRPNGFVW